MGTMIKSHSVEQSQNNEENEIINYLKKEFVRKYNSDFIEIKFLWNNNYRINFYKKFFSKNSVLIENKIINSKFIIVKKMRNNYVIEILDK